MDELLALSDDEQRSLLANLIEHARCKMKRLTWRGAYLSKGGAVPAAREPEDFALEAIRKLLDGTRPWKRDKYDTLEKCLRASIDSSINHVAESVDNRIGRRMATQTAPGEAAVNASSIVSAEGDPLTVVIDEEWRDRFQRSAFKELEGEPLLLKLLECLEAGYTKRSELAVLMEVTVTDVTNLIKRLRRKLEKLTAKCIPRKQTKVVAS